MDTPEVWKSIRDRDGSVQHLEFLSENEKEVFKTYSEIDQLAIIYQAANRQNHLDQGQSLNIIEKMMERDYFMSADEAKKIGIPVVAILDSNSSSDRLKESIKTAMYHGKESILIYNPEKNHLKFFLFYFCFLNKHQL